MHELLLAERRFTSTETVGLLGTGAQDGHHYSLSLICHKTSEDIKN